MSFTFSQKTYQCIHTNVSYINRYIIQIILYPARSSLEEGPSTMNLEEGHWPTEAADMSSMGEGFSSAAREDLLLDTRSELQCCAKLGHKMIPFPFITFSLLFSFSFIQREVGVGKSVILPQHQKYETLEKELVKGQAMPLGITHENYKIKQHQGGKI